MYILNVDSVGVGVGVGVGIGIGIGVGAGVGVGVGVGVGRHIYNCSTRQFLGYGIINTENPTTEYTPYFPTKSTEIPYLFKPI